MADKATILLHLGTHKTGSTSLQYNFGQNRKALREHGVNYLGPDRAYPNLYSAFLTDPMEFFWNRNSKLTLEQISERDTKTLAQLEKALARNTAPWVVISNEFLAMLSADELRQMRDRFAPYGDVRAVYVYRELLDWISSNTQEMAKAGAAVQRSPVGAAVQRIADFPEKIAGVFGREKTHFLRFEDCKGIGICSHFLKTFGLPDFPAMGLKETRENVSVSSPAVEALFAYNRLHPRGSETRDRAEVERLKALPGPRYKAEGFSRDEVALYAKAYETAVDLGLRIAAHDALPRRAEPSRWRGRLARLLGRLG